MPPLLVSSVCRLRWIALSLSCALAACGISPKPEPPEAEPDATFEVPPEDLPDATADAPPDAPPDVVGQPPDTGLGPTLDLERVSPPEVYTRGGEISLGGGPEAASPPGAIIRAYNLDSEEPPVEAIVQEDGSFQLTLPGEAQDEVRIQVITEESRSAPADLSYALDVVGYPPPPIDSLEGALANCLVLDPPAELIMLDSGAVQITNDCDFDVMLAEPQPRVAVPGLVLGADQSWPVTLAPGSSLSVTVELSPDSGFTEEIFFILVTEPAPVRHAITLRVGP